MIHWVIEEPLPHPKKNAVEILVPLTLDDYYALRKAIDTMNKALARYEAGK